jgi:hypothetical protein
VLNYIIKHYAMKAYGGQKVQLHHSTLAPAGTAHFHALSFFTSMDNASSIHWAGGWVGPKTGVVAMERREIALARARNATPVFQHTV